MKNKLKYLTAMSLKRKIQTKWFVAANILIALVIICGINIDTIITAFGGDFDKQQPVYIADHTGVAFDSVKTMMNESSKALNTSSKKSSFDIQKTDKNEKEIKKQVDKKDGLGIIIENDEKSTLKVTIISKDIFLLGFLTSSSSSNVLILPPLRLTISYILFFVLNPYNRVNSNIEYPLSYFSFTSYSASIDNFRLHIKDRS